MWIAIPDPEAHITQALSKLNFEFVYQSHGQIVTFFSRKYLNLLLTITEVYLLKNLEELVLYLALIWTSRVKDMGLRAGGLSRLEWKPERLKNQSGGEKFLQSHNSCLSQHPCSGLFLEFFALCVPESILYLFYIWRGSSQRNQVLEMSGSL